MAYKFKTDEDFLKTLVWLKEVMPKIIETFEEIAQEEGLEITERYMIPGDWVDARFKIRLQGETVESNHVDISIRSIIDELVFKDKRARKVEARDWMTSLDIEDVVRGRVKMTKALLELQKEEGELTEDELREKLKEKLRGVSVAFRVQTHKLDKKKRPKIKPFRGRWIKPKGKKVDTKKKLGEVDAKEN